MLQQLQYRLLLKQYKNKIYNYAYLLLKNRMDADDITQEVFIRIWKNMGNFNLASAKSWIMKTTHNLCLDYLRKNKISSLRGFSIDEELEEKLPDERYFVDPLTNAQNNIQTETIKELIKGLPENLRSVFVLYEMEGFKYEEISRTLNIPLNSVKVYLMRARKKLKEDLTFYEAEEIVRQK